MRCAGTDWHWRCAHRVSCDAQGLADRRLILDTAFDAQGPDGSPATTTVLRAMRSDPMARGPDRRHCDAQGRIGSGATQKNPSDAQGRMARGPRRKLSPCDALGRMALGLAVESVRCTGAGDFTINPSAVSVCGNVPTKLKEHRKSDTTTKPKKQCKSKHYTEPENLIYHIT